MYFFDPGRVSSVKRRRVRPSEVLFGGVPDPPSENNDDKGGIICQKPW